MPLADRATETEETAATTSPSSRWGRAVSTLVGDGPGGLVGMLRHGFGWRYRRLRNRLLPIGAPRETPAARVRGGSSQRRPNDCPHSCGCGSLEATAETALRRLQVATPASSSVPISPTVGIVIPTYRDSGVLGAALQSVRRADLPALAVRRRR